MFVDMEFEVAVVVVLVVVVVVVAVEEKVEFLSKTVDIIQYRI